MFSNADEVLTYIKDEDVKFIDVRFCDLPGVMQHFNVPASRWTRTSSPTGQMFDGSSIRGFQAIHESDMKLIPDPTTAFVDSVPGREDARAELLHRRPVHRRALQPRPAQHRRQGRGLPARLRHRRHRATSGRRRSSTSSTTCASRPSRTRATTTSTPSRAPGTPAASGGGRQPRLQDPLQGRLLPGAPGRPLRRPARPDDARARARPASRSSGRTTRWAPPARPRSTTSSTSLLHAGRPADAVQVHHQERRVGGRQDGDLHAQAALR